MNKEVDVLIVGGGWTGISAAMTLHEHNTSTSPESPVTFALLEGHPDRLGGRAYSFDYSWTDEAGKQRSAAFEHGAQYVGREQTQLWHLIRHAIEQGLIEPDDLVNGYAARLPYKEQVMRVAGKRYPYNRATALFGIGGVPPELGLWDILGVLAVVQLIESIEQSINVQSPWDSPKEVTQLDQMTLHDWIDSLGLSPAAVSLLRVSVEAIISVQADEVSAFYFFWYCACNGGYLNECNDEDDGPQQYYLRNGLDNLIEKLAEPFAEHIHRGQVVQSVSYGDAGAVTVRTNTDTFRAKKVVLAASPASVNKMKFEPPLPDAWQEITGQAMGTTVKCEVFYKHPWWRNVPEQRDPNLQGVPQYTGYCGANDYPVIWTMDYSPPGPPPTYADQGAYCLMTFTIGNEARTLLRENPTKERIVEFVTTALCDLFNDSRALSTSDEYIDLKWFSWDEKTPLIPGGPNTVFGPGMLTGHDAPAKVLDKPVDGRVYFAAAELACKSPAARKSPAPTFEPDWQTLGLTGTYSDWRESLGYMDGAVTCGRYVAHQMLEDLSLRPRTEQRATTRAAADVTTPAPLLPIGGDASSSPIPEPTVVSVLTALCESLYTASAPSPAVWEKNDWKGDPGATPMQIWLAEVLVQTLVQNGLVDMPPQKPAPGFSREQAETYMQQMAQWEPGFITALLGLVSSGYALQSKDAEDQSAGQVARLAELAANLMRLKSSEPNVSSTGQPLSLVRAVRAAGAGDRPSRE